MCIAVAQGAVKRGECKRPVEIFISVRSLERLLVQEDDFRPHGRFERSQRKTRLALAGGDLLYRGSLPLLREKSNPVPSNHSRHKVLTFSNSLRKGVQLLKTT